MRKLDEIKREGKNAIREGKEVFRSDKPKGQMFREFCKWAYKLRSVFLAIPVAVAAIALALHNLISLPANVGFTLATSGEFDHVVDKSVAVFGPLIITFLCLLLMFCSKRVVYPWLISLFSLALPIVILLVNTFSV